MRRAAEMLLALAITTMLAVVAQAAPPARGAVATTRPHVVGVINLNSATPEELERLPGIGPAKARAIVEHRRAHRFEKTDEIMKVKGIGRKTFGRLRSLLTLDGPTTLSGSAAH